MKIDFISIFDKNHLARAAACRRSLAIHAPGMAMSWLCLDDLSYEAATRLGLEDTRILRLDDLGDDELTAVKPTRTLPEFASTCKPAFMLHMMKSGAVGPDGLLVFVDPDFCAYEPLLPYFESVARKGSIIVTPHRFPPARAHEARAKGAYNAGIVCMKKSAAALACLGKWRAQCIEWCFLRYEDGKIGDQGYMADWRTAYAGDLYEIPDKGVNLANWNIARYRIEQKVAGHFTVDGEPLLLYHFHGLKIYRARDGRIKAYPATEPNPSIYQVYLRLLAGAYAELRALYPDWSYGLAAPLSLLRYLKQVISRTAA